MLNQLIYSSCATRPLTSADLNAIISSAQRNNLPREITGALCYARGTFVQCIEGEPSTIDQLYQLLHKDERHSELITIDIKEIFERRFPNWTMGFFSYENEIGQIFLKHSRMAEFEPFSMSASDGNEFFNEVVKYVTFPK